MSGIETENEQTTKNIPKDNKQELDSPNHSQSQSQT